MIYFCGVNRFWSYCVFISVLFYSTPLSQLLQAPMLYIHFIDHEKRQPGITFSDFLSMHYWGNDVNDNDAEEDRKLPFKSITNHIAGDIFIAPKPVAFTFKRPFEEEKKYLLPDHSSLPQNSNAALFRPPRQVC